MHILDNELVKQEFYNHFGLEQTSFFDGRNKSCRLGNQNMVPGAFVDIDFNECTLDLDDLSYYDFKVGTSIVQSRYYGNGFAILKTYYLIDDQTIGRLYYGSIENGRVMLFDVFENSVLHSRLLVDIPMTKRNKSFQIFYKNRNMNGYNYLMGPAGKNNYSNEKIIELVNSSLLFMQDSAFKKTDVSKGLEEHFPLMLKRFSDENNRVS